MKIIGHRGARGLAPENTLASLQKAIDFGVDEIEIDVRVTKDDMPVLMHDPTLKRVAGNESGISDTTFKQLKQIKPDLTTLEEAIRFIDRRVPITIEVKSEQPTEPVLKIIKKLLRQGWKPTDFLLASFSQSDLLALHKALPQVEKVVIEPWSGVRATYRARQLGTKRIAMRSYYIWSWFIRAMHASGFKLVTYSLNNPKKAEQWARHGLYGVITDYPNRYHR
jgi:glycerophosphoryl diester phosphodiesterase